MVSGELGHPPKTRVRSAALKATRSLAPIFGNLSCAGAFESAVSVRTLAIGELDVVRESEPYRELVDGATDVQAGDRVERDDGWWRAVRVMIWQVMPDGNYHSEIEWVPIPPTRKAFHPKTY
jgi:hypothetical protein